jgi:hypothetical protein
VFEVNHVYVQEVGEVERQAFQRLTSTDKKLLEEMRLVEDADAKPAGQKAPAPGAGPMKPPLVSPPAPPAAGNGDPKRSN